MVSLRISVAWLLVCWTAVEATSEARDAVLPATGMVLPMHLPDHVKTEAFKNPHHDPVDELGHNEVPGEPLSPEDFRRAAALKDNDYSRPANGTDPIELAGYFEGDIAGTVTERNAIIDPMSRWHGGVVPYVIANSFDYHERSVIARAIKDYHDNTCLRFKPRTNERDYVFIIKGQGCYSSVGRMGGEQTLSLGHGCVYRGIAAHEMMHAAGFYHEQSREDRDDYIVINWHNIQPGMEYNFAKFTLRQIQHLGEPYDYDSIMHYGSNAFARNSWEHTITPRNPNARLGQREFFSSIDIRKLNKLYGCRGYDEPMDQDQQGDDSCRDRNELCDYWARDGECEKNPGWMHVNCKSACGVCGKPHRCVDDEDSCKAWKREGYCTSYEPYMSIYCRKSCGLCR